jgi:hypothetical protein
MKEKTEEQLSTVQKAQAETRRICEREEEDKYHSVT